LDLRISRACEGRAFVPTFCWEKKVVWGLRRTAPLEVKRMARLFGAWMTAGDRGLRRTAPLEVKRTARLFGAWMTAGDRGLRRTAPLEVKRTARLFGAWMTAGAARLTSQADDAGARVKRG